MRPSVLLLPGLYDSGPAHWQRVWQREQGFTVVEQADWATPRRQDWTAVLEWAVGVTSGPIVLCGHSTACALIAFWSAETGFAARVRGALLVGPSDTEAPSYPDGPTGFAPMPRAPLPFASIVVASSDDPYVTPARARDFAASWGSALVEIGAAGHINAASGHGPWPEGLALLDAWLA